MGTKRERRRKSNEEKEGNDDSGYEGGDEDEQGEDADEYKGEDEDKEDTMRLSIKEIRSCKRRHGQRD